MYGKIISFKKFALAKEIYQELKKRIQLPPVKKHLSLKDMDVLFRALLSCFCDEVHIKSGDSYQRENEIRQPDRTSVLFQSRPDMLVGLPFDLIINRENRSTGETGQVLLPLITFASELTLAHLETLKPFSYNKKETVFVEDSRLAVHREFYFGGKTIKAFTSLPDWNNPQEKEQAAQAALKWYEENKTRFDIPGKMGRAEESFNEIKTIVKGKPGPFEFYCRDFLLRELRRNLNMENLGLFFKLHKGFMHIHLGKLLPYGFIKELKKAGWPGFLSLETGEERLNIEYIGHKPFVEMDYTLFEKVREEELLLPTGEWVGVILGGRKFYDWGHAVYEFNRWKKRNIFEKKYRDLKKPGRMEDLLGIPFPQAFESGRGKDNMPFEFYIVPGIEGEVVGEVKDEVCLRHFFEKDEAGVYFEAIRTQWEEYVRLYKKKKLENIFKQKGWKVKE